MTDCPDPHFWLSFVDPAKPEGERFLGVAVVQAYDERGAIIVSHINGCNPGGEVMMAGPFPGAVLPAVGDYVGRLLNRAETEALERLIVNRRVETRKLQDSLTRALRILPRERKDAAVAKRERRECQYLAALAGVAAHKTYKEIGLMMGLSHHRVQQIVASARRVGELRKKRNPNDELVSALKAAGL